MVLGAGVIGVTAAWYLAQDGHQVSVIDRQADVSRETSFANGGQISASHAEPWARPAMLPKLIRWLGSEQAPLLFRPLLDAAQWEWALRFLVECLPGRFEKNSRELAGLALYSRDCLAQLRADTAIQYDRAARGILQLCTNPRDFAVLARHAENARGYGVEREVVDAAQCVAIEPALQQASVRLEGGIYAPRDESGDANLFSKSLRALLQARQVEFEFNSEILRLECEADAVTGVQVRCNGVTRTLRADAFVVALASYSNRLLAPAGIRLPVYPLKGYSVTLDLDRESAAGAPAVSLTDEAGKIVISRLGNRLRAAGTAELSGYDLDADPERCAAIERRVVQFFPKLSFEGAAGRPVGRWAGLRPATPNNLPIIGRTKFRNLNLNTGHGTLGWTLACGSGRATADIIGLRRPEVAFKFRGLA